MGSRLGCLGDDRETQNTNSEEERRHFRASERKIIEELFKSISKPQGRLRFT